MGIDVDVDDSSKEGMVVGDECKDSAGIGGAECEDRGTDVGRTIGHLNVRGKMVI
jgi:hypothetical protein